MGPSWRYVSPACRCEPCKAITLLVRTLEDEDRWRDLFEKAMKPLYVLDPGPRPDISAERRDLMSAARGDTLTPEKVLRAKDILEQVVNDMNREGLSVTKIWMDEFFETPGHLPVDAAERKAIPLASGCIDYFPDALLAVAALSKIGGEQHNPGKPLFWDRAKSGDEGDCLMRHFVDRGTLDTDGVRHSAKVAWRALALLQKEIEAESGYGPGSSSPALAPRD